MTRDPLWPLTEGEAFLLSRLAAVPITENPEAGEFYLAAGFKPGLDGKISGGFTLHSSFGEFEKAVNPTVNDDAADGFYKGSLWINTATGQAFICLDATIGAAIWQKFSAAAGATDTSENIDWDGDSTQTPPTRQVGNIMTFEMRKTPVKSVIGHSLFPNEANLTVNPTLQIPFIVVTTGTGTPNVRLQLEVTYVAVGELGNQAAQENLFVTKAVNNTLNEFHNVSFTLNASLISVNDFVSLRFTRIGTDPLDTWSGQIGIVRRAQLRYRKL